MAKLLVTLAVFLVCGAAHAEKPRLAVLDLEPKGVDKTVAANLTDLTATALKKLGVFDVVSRSDIQQMLAFEQDKQIVGCASSTSCVAELAGALGVATVITGSVGKIGSEYLLTLMLIDSKAAKVLERESRSAPSLAALTQLVDAVANTVVRSLLSGKQGELIVRGAESGAEVELDGKLVGITPLPRLKLASGPHQVRVSKKGFVALAQDVTVKPNETLSIEASLMPSPDFIKDYDRLANGLRAGAWGAIGGGGALLATGFIVYFAVADRQNAQHNAARPDILASARTADSDAAYNKQAQDIQGLYRAGQALTITGAVVAAAGVVLFFAAPKPGVYDQWKSIEIAGVRASFDVSPMSGGLYGQTRLTF